MPHYRMRSKYPRLNSVVSNSALPSIAVPGAERLQIDGEIHRLPGRQFTPLLFSEGRSRENSWLWALRKSTNSVSSTAGGGYRFPLSWKLCQLCEPARKMALPLSSVEYLGFCGWTRSGPCEPAWAETHSTTYATAVLTNRGIRRMLLSERFHRSPGSFTNSENDNLPACWKRPAIELSAQRRTRARRTYHAKDRFVRGPVRHTLPSCLGSTNPARHRTAEPSH